ncbi:gem-associated protein 8-like [Penaeus chinensis]|uniref:gem-associated protein 8-like n=1 Tax=Penaeus chinensis TaxID=139456 RepID=UPI001FB79DD7|nr:gem-associated protein 8-like [Penaeus chinensis]XP_047485423.1 gem-associated protein 8-like [Penaeus chinensis]XP_047485432.1 gem-associated protein 8-like [Penaeus chinensis]
MYSDSQVEKHGENPWYYDKRYARFWHHYNTMMMTAHKDAVVRARHIASHTNAALSGMLKKQPCQNLPRYSDFSRHRKSSKSLTDISRSSRNRKKRKRKKKNRQIRTQAILDSQGTVSDSEALQSQMSQGMHLQDEEENMEVSEDFLEFIQQSEQHRVEWKTRKVKKALDEEKQSEDSESNSTPKEHPDVVRSREMHQLYGEAAARIHAMETAVQLSFDRISTLYQPQYWPNIPLKLIF